MNATSTLTNAHARTRPDVETDTVPTVPGHGGRTWTITTTNGLSVTGHLPDWAEDDPSKDGVTVERLSVELTDMTHEMFFNGQLLDVVHGSDPAEQREVLAGTITCHPCADAPDPRIPVANIVIVDDFWLTDLDPTGLAAIAARLRAQADHLDNEIRPTLIAARNDWTDHHHTA